MNDEEFTLVAANIPDISEVDLWDALSDYNEFEDTNSEYTIVVYILRDFVKQGRTSITQKEINTKFNQLVVDFCLSNLVNKGLVDTDFNESGEITYKLNDNGHQYVEKFNIK